MTCRSIETQLDDYLDDALDADSAFVIEQHATACAGCASLLAHARRVRSALAGLGVEGPAAGFLEEALASAARHFLVGADRHSSGNADRDSARNAAGQSEQKQASQRSSWYVGAVAAGVAVFALVGFLVVETDSGPAGAGVAQLQMALEETRTINMVFNSDEALADVSLEVLLPDGIELASYPGRSQIVWSTQLQAGKNVLPLELVAAGGTGGELVATMRRDGRAKVFRVSIAVLSG